MSRRPVSGREFEPPKVEIRAVRFGDRGGEVIVRIRNDNDRAVHYVSDVRGMLVDAAARRLTIRLSDSGRALVAGLGYMEPEFRYIDPHSDAELQILIPPRMVKLAAGGAVSDEVRFEEHRPADATEIVMEIGWADTPFYQDPRDRAKEVHPAAAWEQGRATASIRLDRGKDEVPGR